MKSLSNTANGNISGKEKILLETYVHSLLPSVTFDRESIAWFRDSSSKEPNPSSTNNVSIWIPPAFAWVVPKEIRRTLRIREGDPMEIFTNRDGENL